MPALLLDTRLAALVAGELTHGATEPEPALPAPEPSPPARGFDRVPDGLAALMR